MMKCENGKKIQSRNSIKKIIVLLFILLLMLSVAAACGGEKAKEKEISTQDIIDKYGQETYNLVTSISSSASVFLGSYEQDFNYNNGPEPLEWIVLDTEYDDDNVAMLLMSKYVIDYGHYHQTFYGTDWQTGALRKNMNEDIYSVAFSSGEKNIIRSTVLDDDTSNKLFTLNRDELKKYIKDDKQKNTTATEYASAMGVYIDPENGYSPWWLRDGDKNGKGYFVDYTGEIDKAEYNMGIRLFMWVNVSSLIKTSLESSKIYTPPTHKDIPMSSEVLFKCKITESGHVNVYGRPSGNEPVKRTLSKGDIVNVYEQQEASGSGTKWYRIGQYEWIYSYLGTQQYISIEY